MAFCLISLPSAPGSVPLPQQSAFGTYHIIHPPAEKKMQFCFTSWEASTWGEGSAGRGMGRMRKSHGVWSHPASWTPEMGGFHDWSCLLPGKEVSAPWVEGHSGVLHAMWQVHREKVFFFLDAPDICICNPFGFQSLFSLPKCVLTAS